LSVLETPPGVAEGAQASDHARCMQSLLWHPANLNTRDIRVWDLIAHGVRDVEIMAETLSVHRVSISRCITTLCEQGLMRRTAEQGRDHGRYERFGYEALDPNGNPHVP